MACPNAVAPVPPAFVAQAAVVPSELYLTTNTSRVPTGVTVTAWLVPNVVFAVKSPTAIAPPSVVTAARRRLVTVPATPADVTEKSVPSALYRARKNPPDGKVVAPAWPALAVSPGPKVGVPV